MRLADGPRLSLPRMFCQFCGMQVGADRSNSWACSRDVGGPILAQAMAVVSVLLIVVMVMSEFMGTPEAFVSCMGHFCPSNAEMRDWSVVMLFICFLCHHAVKEARSSCCCQCAHSGLGFVDFLYCACRRGMCTSCQRRQTEWTTRSNLWCADSPEGKKPFNSGNNCSEESEIDELDLELDRSGLVLSLRSPVDKMRRKSLSPERVPRHSEQGDGLLVCLRVLVLLIGTEGIHMSLVA